jgi:hypothetical protein
VASPTAALSTPEATAPTTPTPTPSESTKAPGVLTVSTSSISLGRSASSSTITLTNSGELPVDYRLTSSAGWLSASPASGRVEGGTSSRLTVRADRGRVREGSSSGTIGISWVAGGAKVAVSLVEERGPNVGRPSAGSSSTCTSNPVQVSASDESGLRSVVLRWSGAGSGSAPMSERGGVWRADMGQFANGGSVTMQVTATDKRGNTTTGPSRTINVDPCPG